MTDTKHTPTPWILSNTRAPGAEGYEFQTPSLDGDGDYIGAGYTAADAQHIVRCVNAHDELVAALTLIAAQCEAMNVGEIGSIRPAEVARAALAKVQS